MIFIGDHWGIWCGGSGESKVAMLVTLVTGGFHSCTKYQWWMDDTRLQGEEYPVYYATSRGTYICTCNTSDSLIKVDMKFKVIEGILV